MKNKLTITLKDSTVEIDSPISINLNGRFVIMEPWVVVDAINLYLQSSGKGAFLEELPRIPSQSYSSIESHPDRKELLHQIHEHGGTYVRKKDLIKEDETPSASKSPLCADDQDTPPVLSENAIRLCKELGWDADGIRDTLMRSRSESRSGSPKPPPESRLWQLLRLLKGLPPS